RRAADRIRQGYYDDMDNYFQSDKYQSALHEFVTLENALRDSKTFYPEIVAVELLESLDSALKIATEVNRVDSESEIFSNTVLSCFDLAITQQPGFMEALTEWLSSSMTRQRLTAAYLIVENLPEYDSKSCLFINDERARIVAEGICKYYGSRLDGSSVPEELEDGDDYLRDLENLSEQLQKGEGRIWSALTSFEETEFGKFPAYITEMSLEDFKLLDSQDGEVEPNQAPGDQA
ncbi:MAG: hypothetical protein KDD62_14815, partial [Bdellovibrionales bacterium]|nr:hypothetical protein [Bdellovibrionales bacterium]